MNMKVFELVLARFVAYAETHPELLDKLIGALIDALVKLAEKQQPK